jgi:hypothetical protein
VNRFTFLGSNVDIGHIEKDIAFRDIVLDVDPYKLLVVAANAIQGIGDRLDRILIVAQRIDKESSPYAYDRWMRDGFLIENGRFGW